MTNKNSKNKHIPETMTQNKTKVGLYINISDLMRLKAIFFRPFENILF